jgi:peptide/nickel transport system substrate-binding protein
LVSGPNGEKLERNPLKDVRVRRALSMAVDREVIRVRLMGGLSVPAGQLVPEGVSGHVRGLGPDKHDVDGARKLLAEAGYPDGFSLTLHGSNDRYVNDGQILQAVAAAWRRVGIKTAVEVMPFATMATQVRSRAVSAYMVGLAAVTGDATGQLRSLVMTFNQQRGTGTLNYARFSDAGIDAAVDRAFSAPDEASRLKAVEEATRAAMEQAVLLPIHFQVTTWGARSNLVLAPRVDEYTMAHEIRPK